MLEASGQGDLLEVLAVAKSELADVVDGIWNDDSPKAVHALESRFFDGL